MEKITIEGKQDNSDIFVGKDIASLKEHLPPKNVFIISDRNVFSYHKKKFPDFPVCVVDPGEKSKDFSVMTKIYLWLLENGADRNSFIVGIGGGVVCDLAGFVAATFMRGIPFGFVATSLLAQVDASVGGKNGVNLSGFKNIVGTFAQPRFVICDTQLLDTLPDEEFRNGLAEMIKHALIRDAGKFSVLDKDKYLILQKNKNIVDSLVTRSVRIKAAIVQADETEKGLRKLLNFGHTWGHAIEKATKIAHGKAVSIGMVFAANLSVQRGYLSVDERDRIIKLLNDYQLPVVTKVNPKDVFDALLHDKKREQNKIHFVLLRSIGDAFIEEIETNELKKFVLGSLS